jgi:uncharacterized membrane protein
VTEEEHGTGSRPPDDIETSPQGLDRIVFFSDAVFAIAITLLVIQISVPPASEHDVGSALADRWPQFTSFALSFLVIGLFWSRHHLMFRYIVKSDNVLLWLNLGLLLCIAFMPYPTALVGEHSHDRVAAILYAGTMTIAGLAAAALWGYASYGGRLLVDGTDARLIRYLRQRPLVVTLVFASSMLVALGSVRAAELLWVLVFPLLALLRRAHGDPLSRRRS